MDPATAKARVTEMADKLLANPVIESYRVEVLYRAAGASTPRLEARAMKFAVIVFPGSNSDRDAWYAASQVLGQQAALVWHKDTDLAGADAVILPGGFAHGDYLRTGAIARFSPIMTAVARFAERGGPVLGICNGFQVLLEAGLLPGAMVRNRGIKFVSQHVHGSRRAHRHALYDRVHARAGPARCRSRTAKATTLRNPTCSPSSRRATGDLPLRHRRRSANLTRPTPTDREQHRRHLQSRSQCRRTDAAPRARL